MSAKASEKSSARNVNHPTHPSRSTTFSCTPKRPPFIHSVFLVLVHGGDIPRILRDTNFPALDSIAHRGVTTAVMLTAALRHEADDADGLSSYMHTTAQRHSRSDTQAVRTYLAEDVYNIFRKPNLSEIRGVHFIRAPDLATADHVVAHLTSVLSPLLCADRQTTAAAIGVVLTGDGDWSQLVRLPNWHGSGLVHVPRQSYQIGVDELPTLGGLMCFAGSGIVRKDSRERLALCYGPGDGCLRPDQIVLEVLSKTELVGKFGA